SSRPPTPCHPGGSESALSHKGRGKSRDNIRRQRILEMRDAIFQMQLALFQPLDLQPVARADPLQRFDRAVEIAVLLFEAGQFGAKRGLVVLVLDHAGMPVLARE